MKIEKAQQVFVLNCGSSSIKFGIVDAVTGAELLSGLAEALYLPEASLTYKMAGESTTLSLTEEAGCSVDHQLALTVIAEQILSPNPQLQENLCAVSHRVVHGGEHFSETTRITDAVLTQIEACNDLAPLHNPANVAGIRAAQQMFAHLPHFAVFDTAFHQTLPEKAYRYAIPEDLYQQEKVRRYGFHGTSHAFCSEKLAEQMGIEKPNFNVISCHLGNGASICAIRAGHSVDTSMGMTPLAGLVMGTRSGDIDPSVVFYLQTKKQWNTDQIDQLLNKQSGLLGLSGLSSDCRTIEAAASAGDVKAQLALDIFAYRLAQYIGSYFVSLGRVDAIYFTGGIGENSSYLREQTVAQLTVFGIRLDDEANAGTSKGREGRISSAESAIPVYVVKTNEEWQLAKEALQQLV